MPPTSSVPTSIVGFGAYSDHNGHRYFLSNTTKTWKEASKIADSLGGYLAIPNDTAEQVFLTTLASSQLTWIGITDQATEGTWLDVFGNTISYFKWYAGQPDNYNNEDYVHLKENGNWNDAPDEYLLNFIIEFNGASSSLTAPYGLTITAFSTNSYSLSWSSSSTSTYKNYNIYRSENNGLTYVKIGNSTTTSYTDNTVTSTKLYKYKVSESSNIDNGLINFFPFNTNTNDYLNATISGTVTGASLTTDRFSNSNSAYEFNGTNQFIEFPNTLANVTQSATQTISVWANRTSGSNIIAKYYNLDASLSQFFINTQSIAGNGTNSLSFTTPSAGWNHYVIVLQSGTNNTKVYINGVLITSGTLNYNASTTSTKLVAGRFSNGGSYDHFGGKIDDIRIYNRALSSTEVSNLYALENSASVNVDETIFSNITSISSALIYVNKVTGSNSNNGSNALPYATIQFALDNAKEGDTILISDHTYTEALNITSSLSNLTISSKYILDFDSTHIKTAIIDAVNTTWANIHINTNTGLTFYGISLKNAKGRLISAINDTIIFKKSIISNLGYNSSNITTNSIIAKNVYIDSTSISNNIFIEGLITADSVSMKNSKFYNNQGGLVRNGGGGFSNIAAYIFNNTIYDNSKLIGSGSSMGDYFILNVVRQHVIRNKFYRNNYMNILGGSYAGYQKVINNLFYKNTTNGVVARTVHVNSSDSLIMIHNTFIDNNVDFTAHPNGFWPGIIYNNIFTGTLQFSGPTPTGFDLITFKMKGNLFKTFPTFPQVDTAGSSENNLFTSIAYIDSANLNFTYSDNEPRLGNAATFSYPVFDDINGNPRPNPLGSKSEIGAFESIKSSLVSASPIITSIETSGKSVTLKWTQTGISGVTKFKIYRDSSSIIGSSPTNINAGLIAYYPFTGNIIDSSGNNNLATATNTSLTTDRFGVTNSAYTFSGTNSFIQTNALSQEVTNRTYSAWVNLSNLTQSAGGLVGLQSNDASVFDVITYNESNEGWGFGSEYYSRNKYSNVKEISTSTWAMLTATYEQNLFKLYRNGILIDSTKSFSLTRFGTTSKINIGIRHNTGYTPFLNGKIDDVRLYNRAISSGEVLSLYNYELKNNAERAAVTGLSITAIDSVNNSTLTFTDNVSGFKKYYYRIVAVNANGVESELSNEMSAFVFDTVTLKSPLSNSIDNLVKPNLSWTTKTNAIKYRLQVSKDTTFALASLIDSVLTVNSFDFTKSLTSNTKFFWRIKAGDNTGYGIWSDIFSFKTIIASPSLDSINSDDKIVKLKWSHPDALMYTRFNIYRDTASISGTTGLDANLTTNLTAHYLFSGNALDSSSSGNNGTVFGATLTTDRFGNTNSAYLFNGSTQYIEFPSSVANVTQTNPYSISVWINQTSGSNVLGKYHNLDAGLSQFYFNTGALYGNGTNSISLTSPASGWNHYVIILQSGTSNTKVYKNGVLLTSGTLNYNSAITATKFVVGRISDGGYYDHFGGKIDDIRVYNKILSATDVVNLYRFENLNPASRSYTFPIENLIVTKNNSTFELLDTLLLYKKYYYRTTAITTDGRESDLSNELSVTLSPISEVKKVCVGGTTGLSSTATTRVWTQVGSVLTKAMTSAWSNILAGTNTNKDYKLVVSGTWGIANGVRHRDAAYSSTNSTVAITSPTSNPVANRGCDANWLFEGSCPPPIPSAPIGYAVDNTYEYLLGKGKSSGFAIAFSDGNYADNAGTLIFTLYESVSSETTSKISTINNAMTTSWSSILGATNPDKNYKLVVSGTWGIANGVKHRDAAYSSTNSSVAITAPTSNPIANRGCDGNWLFEGSCPPPIPTSPIGYSSTNTYEYLIGRGKAGGYSISFSDGNYADNSGNLVFDLFEVVNGVWSSDDTTIAKVSNVGLVSGISIGTTKVRYTSINGSTVTVDTKTIIVNALPSKPSVVNTKASNMFCIGSTVSISATASTGHILNWYTNPIGGSFSSTTPIVTTTIADTIDYYVSQTSATTGCESLRDTITIYINPNPSAPAITNASWNLVKTTTKLMTNGWSDIMNATDPTKQYKMVISGTWGIANSVRHRDAAYSSTNSVVAITSPTSNPVANRGCDANWLFEGSCPPPVPSAPIGYAADNTYEYLFNGKAGGYSIAFTDGGYGDNSGSLVFSLYEQVGKDIILFKESNARVLTAPTTIGNTLKWHTLEIGGTGSSTAIIPSTSVVGSTNYFVSQVATSSGCESSRSKITVVVNALPSKPTITLPTSNKVKELIQPKFIWSKVNSTSKYNLQVSLDSTFTNFGILDTVIVDTQFVSNVILNRNANYYWRVKLGDDNNYVPWSDKNKFQTNLFVPVEDSIKANGNIVSLNWSLADTSRIKQFKIYRDLSPINASNILDTALSSGLVTHYTFNGNANDSSSSLNNAVVNGATLTTDRFGNANAAYSFNGTNNSITAKTSKLPLGNSKRSFSFWVYYNKPLLAQDATYNDWTGILSYGSNTLSGGCQALNVWISPEKYPIGQGASLNGESCSYVKSDSIATYGAWHNIVLTFGDSLRIYLNGKQVTATKSVSQNNFNTTDNGILYIGRINNNINTNQKYYLNGKLDDFRIYNKALTSLDVSNLFNYESTDPSLRASASSNTGVSVSSNSNVNLSIRDTVPKFTKYYYRVAAVNRDGVESDYSNELSVYAYQAPTLTTPINNQYNINQQADFTWVAISNATRYQLQISTDSTFIKVTEKDTITNMVSFKNQTIFNVNTTYYWRVRVIGTNTFGSWSAVNRFLTSIPLPVFTSLKGGNKVDTLTWTYSSPSNISYFKIYRDIKDSPTKFIDSVAGISNNYIDKLNLLNGITYFYRITAVSKDGVESSFSLSKSIMLINKSPKAAALNNKTIKDVGEFNFTKLTFSGSTSSDPDGNIIKYAWFVNGALINKTDSVLSYLFKQGTNELKLVVSDEDDAKDSSIATVTLTSFVKKFTGGFLGGISAVGPNLIYTADSTYDPISGASVYLLDRSGNTIFPLIVSSKIFTTPSVSADSSVFIASGSSLNGFSKSGAPLWPTIALGGNSYVTPTIDSVLQRIYLGVSNKNLFAIDYKTGKIIWNVITDNPINTSAVITGDRKLVITSQSGTLYGFDIFTNEVQTAPKWKIVFGDIITKSPAIDATNNIYVGTDAGRFIKLKLEENGTVTVKWNITLASAIESSPVIDADGFVYVGAKNGDFYKINPNNGNTIWIYNTGASIYSAPYITEFGSILIANKKGLVTAIDTDKNLLWKYQDKAAISANILYIKGMLYFGSESGDYSAIYDFPNSVAINDTYATSAYSEKQNIKNASVANTIVARDPIWGTFQGNYRRNGSKPIDCPSKPIVTSSSGLYAFCQGASVNLSFTDTVSNFTWKYDSLTTISTIDKTITANKAGNYKVAVKNIYGCITYSDTYSISELKLPTTPSITRNSENLLVSSYPVGNKWYKDGIALADTSQLFKPTTTGNYTVKSTQNTCQSSMSLGYYYVVTDIVNIGGDQFIRINPNPFINKLFLSFRVNGNNTLNVNVYDFASGKLVAKRKNISTGNDLDLVELPSGVYIFQVYSNDNKTNYTFKIVKI